MIIYKELDSFGFVVASYSNGAMIQVSTGFGDWNLSYSCITVQNIMH